MERTDAPAKTPILAVVGSTGTGKSQLAVEMAEYVKRSGDAEIVSADSMQTYEGLDVITNKAAPEEMRDIPHHLMSFLEPGHEYDITQFMSDATRLVRFKANAVRGHAAQRDSAGARGRHDVLYPAPPFSWSPRLCQRERDAGTKGEQRARGRGRAPP